jgi:hypothetical protein
LVRFVMVGYCGRTRANTPHVNTPHEAIGPPAHLRRFRPHLPRTPPPCQDPPSIAQRGPRIEPNRSARFAHPWAGPGDLRHPSATAWCLFAASLASSPIVRVLDWQARRGHLLADEKVGFYLQEPGWVGRRSCRNRGPRRA